MTLSLSIGQCATLACLLEATAPKVGNVHRGADFEDLTFADLAAAAVAVAPAMQAACERPLGATILSAVQATRRVAGGNPNLGMVLLLAPLAAVPRTHPLSAGVAQVLAGLTPDDSRDVYEAIRLAAPGGLGRREKMDVAGPAPDSLLEAMRDAAPRDLVARQYSEDFQFVLGPVASWILQGVSQGRTLSESVIRAQLQVLCEHEDTLIARKCGADVARQASLRAARALEEEQAGRERYLAALADLDFWMRSDGHRRNPGATADLIAAALFALLRDERLQPLLR